MSKRRSAASRRAELQRRARASRDRPDEAPVYSDEAFGIDVRRIAPGGGQDRVQVRWTVDREPYFGLMALHRLREGVLFGLELELVQELRERGTAWVDIGWALGITGEAARLRFKEEVSA